MKLEQLLEGVSYTLVQGSLELDIEDIIYDSRKAAPGRLFVCIVGTQRDSHDYASRRADSPATSGYWIKDMRYTEPRWEPFPWEIEGFDFKPGFEARIRIRPVAEYDDAKGDYEVKYDQTELISSEEKASEELP